MKKFRGGLSIFFHGTVELEKKTHKSNQDVDKNAKIAKNYKRHDVVDSLCSCEDGNEKRIHISPFLFSWLSVENPVTSRGRC